MNYLEMYSFLNVLGFSIYLCVITFLLNSIGFWALTFYDLIPLKCSNLFYGLQYGLLW